MRIGIVTPAPPGSTYGNRVTALRWAGILRRLGHRVSILQTYDARPHELLIALHARRSHSSIKRFHDHHPTAPIIVALTGTDLYRDFRNNHLAQKSLASATRIVVLQPKALEKLPPELRDKTQVIYQSVENLPKSSGSGGTKKHARQQKSSDSPLNNFDVSIIGHLRPVKDPFRAAFAARLLGSSSRIRILQIGGAMTTAMFDRAKAEARGNPRYHWLGQQSKARTFWILSQSQLCVIPSRIEGGANSLSEAIVASVPVLASRIDGNVGILGRDYPGLFKAGDTRQLSRLMTRAETDSKFLTELREHIKKLAPLFAPAREERAWARLIRGLR